MSTGTYAKKNFMVRVAQSVAHEEIANRTEADSIGRQIADFALANWDRVMHRYGRDTTDEFEMMERLTRDALEHRARTLDAVFRSLPRL